MATAEAAQLFAPVRRRTWTRRLRAPGPSAAKRSHERLSHRHTTPAMAAAAPTLHHHRWRGAIPTCAVRASSYPFPRHRVAAMPSSPLKHVVVRPSALSPPSPPSSSLLSFPSLPSLTSPSHLPSFHLCVHLAGGPTSSMSTPSLSLLTPSSTSAFRSTSSFGRATTSQPSSAHCSPSCQPNPHTRTLPGLPGASLAVHGPACVR